LTACKVHGVVDVFVRPLYSTKQDIGLKTCGPMHV